MWVLCFIQNQFLTNFFLKTLNSKKNGIYRRIMFQFAAKFERGGRPKRAIIKT
jgi:hypothetical protein